MTNPTIFAAGYSTADSYHLAPSGQGDGPREIVRTITVPALTATDTIMGFFPFQKGCHVSYGAAVTSADLDTSTNVTLDVGYVYDDSTTYTNDLDAFISASTIPQAGGISYFDEAAGATFVAEANGWVIAQVNAATTTAGAVTFNGGISYQV